MICGTVRAEKTAPRGRPRVTLGAGAGASVGGADTGAVGATMGTLRYELGVLKGVGTARLKMVARCLMSSNLLATILAKGVAGAGCSRAWIRSRAACRVESLEDVFGTVNWCGGKWTVLAVHSARVFVM